MDATKKFIGSSVKSSRKNMYSYKNKKRLSIVDVSISPMQAKHISINYTFSSSLWWIGKNLQGNKAIVTCIFYQGHSDILKMNLPYSLFFMEIM